MGTFSGKLNTPLRRAIVELAFASGAGMVLQFLRVLIVVRAAGSQSYGQYGFVTAVISFSMVLFDSLDKGLIRFLPESPREELSALVWGSYSFKFLVYGFATAVLLLGGPWVLHVTGKEAMLQIPLHFWLLAITIGWFAFTNSTLNALLVASEKYTGFARFTVFEYLLDFIVAFILIFCVGFSGERAVLAAFAAQCTSMSLRFIRNVWLFHEEWLLKYGPPKIGLRNLRIFAQIYQTRMHSYVSPLLGVNLFSYLKMDFPSVLLGTVSGMSHVTVYEVVQNVYKALNSFLPKIAQAMVPTLVRRQAEARELFARQFKKTSALYMALLSFAALAIFAAHPLIVYIFRLPSEGYSYWVLFGIFSIELIVLSYMVTVTLLVLGSDSTRIMLAASPLRHLTFLGACALLFPRFSIYGMAWARLIGTVAAALLFYFSGAGRKRLAPKTSLPETVLPIAEKLEPTTMS